MPIISEALGHSHTESTMYYLRIDITTLRQCALNVTLVPKSFYAQVCHQKIHSGKLD